MTVPAAAALFEVRAASFDAHSGIARHESLDEAVAQFQDPGVTTWLLIATQDLERSRELLEARLGFHQLAVEDALSSDERPALQNYGDHVFFVIPAVNGRGDDDRFVEVAFFLTPGGLATVSSRPLARLDGWFDAWVRQPGRVGQSSAVLAHTLVDSLIDDYFPLADDLEDRVDEIADAVFQGATDQVPDILAAKRRLLEMRRRIAPARDVLNSLLRRDVVALPDDLRPYFQDVLDHVLRVSEMLDLNRETLASMLDVHLSTVSNNVNVILKKMTVLSTVLMSMALIAGIYGMNFQHMPELAWSAGYPFAIGLMLVAAGLVLGLFRLKKWL